MATNKEMACAPRISVSVAIAVATTSIVGSVHAQDQAQVDLQSALQTSQQAAQQQQQMFQQQMQQQSQQQFLGNSGVQPYCMYYGGCAPATAASINAWRKILPGVYDQVLPMYDVRDTDLAPDTVHPTVRHHHRLKEPGMRVTIPNSGVVTEMRVGSMPVIFS